jgi:hypothetical protein
MLGVDFSRLTEENRPEAGEDWIGIRNILQSSKAGVSINQIEGCYVFKKDLSVFTAFSPLTIPKTKATLLENRVPKGFFGCPHRITLFGSR